MKKTLICFGFMLSILCFSQQEKDSIKKILEKQIEAVELKAKRKLIEMKTNKFIFNIEGNGLVAGGNAIDILNVTPGLQINNDQISMIGKNAMGVMIDNRLLKMSGEELTAFLKNLKSEDIKSIEVISNPSSKYSAEGNSGLINIIMKKNRTDFWKLTVSNAFQQATKAQNTSSLNFNYKKNKISIYSGLNYNYGKYVVKESSEIYYPQLLWKSIGKSIYKNNNISGKFGLDYEVNKKFQLGVFYTGSHNEPVTDNQDFSESIEGNNISRYDTNGLTKRKRDLHTFNIHSVNKLDSLGTFVNTDFDYLDFNNTNNRIFDSYINGNLISPKQNTNNSTQSIKNYSLNIEVNQPIKFAKLNYGGKLSFSNTFNELHSDINSVGFEQNDLFKYIENTQALFFSAEKELSKKWSSEIGIRWENTQLEGNNLIIDLKQQKKYSKIFPTFYLNYNPTENHNISLQYGKRIGRPSFSDLNPFRVYYSPFSYWEGNPQLTPSYTHNIELNYIYKGILQSVLSYQRTQDSFAGIVLLNSNNIDQKVTSLNYANTESYTFRQTYVYNKKKWLKSYLTLYTGYQRAKSKITPLTPEKVEGTYLTFLLNSSFTLNKNSSIGFNFTHRLAAKSLDMVYNEPNTMMSLYYQTKLWDKLNVSININNIFKEYQFNTNSVRNGNETTSKGYYDSRYIRLTLTYTLGGNINVKSKDSKNQDEQNRIN